MKGRDGDDDRGEPATILLVRHAHTDAIGRRLTGRLRGVPLSEVGRNEAEHLGRALTVERLAAIYTGPLERGRATAAAIARYQQVEVYVDEEVTEVDFGDWTGKSFDELAENPEWRAFNTARGSADVPGGERASLVQHRIVGALERMAAAHPGNTIAVVSHADVIRAAVLHYAATPLDLFDRFEISPASVTAVTLGPSGPRLLCVNNRALSGNGIS